VSEVRGCMGGREIHGSFTSMLPVFRACSMSGVGKGAWVGAVYGSFAGGTRLAQHGVVCSLALARPHPLAGAFPCVSRYEKVFAENGTTCGVMPDMPALTQQVSCTDTWSAFSFCPSPLAICVAVNPNTELFVLVCSAACG
jgi:hypothetical protein